ncbi:MAG: hypothetical protein NXI10_12190 [bacterium]|nr:hypothetical protein [bacterium]
MLTSIEIAKLLKKQQKDQNEKQGFDVALIGLGIALKNTKKKMKVAR